LIALAVRFLLRPAVSEAELNAQKPLSPYEAACLAAGPKRAIDAAVAAMVQADMLRIEEQETSVLGVFKSKAPAIVQGAPPPSNAEALERAIYDAAAKPARNVLVLHAAANSVADDIQSQLAKRGLVHGGGEISLAQIAAGLIMASPLLLGVAKVIVGVDRGRPVMFLVVACVATLIAALAFVFFRRVRTAQGDALLEEYQGKYGEIRQRAAAEASALSAGDMGMIVGLFGASMLAAGPLDALFRVTSHTSGGGGCGTSGGCSAGGCGGGGGGCGGGGGGGCGGCGG
jgi:uncharacterized protein (TIGR04222 family)